MVSAQKTTLQKSRSWYLPTWNATVHRSDFSKPLWSDAILITPCHKVQEEWNYYALIKHCKVNNQVQYIVPAEDSKKGTDEDPSKEACLATAYLDEKKTGNLWHNIDLAIGMKAIVLINLAVEADIANGT